MVLRGMQSKHNLKTFKITVVSGWVDLCLTRKKIVEKSYQKSPMDSTPYFVSY